MTEFDIRQCVNYITLNNTKKLSEIFGKWLDGSGITRIQWIALFFLKTNGKLSQRELSQAMEINDSSALRLVDRLERDGFVTRTRSKEDRRVIHLDLTQRGSDLMDKLLPIGEQFNQVLIQGIPQEEIEIFINVQTKMYKNIINDERSQI
ncbi:MarR family winged helix-turn-helix transcriptional regulator [Anaerotignum sp. MB30-C6]|uniref:MarR family winged helix-turn-helix transcriptional regulator n=1 Tax=Anaerotignum sp. MB30-C6 TaxID=3070814 RepID=UPI0027DB0FAE|nr:MarR family transcriptional regulator [Anaerotignum sp. MB30-C6]WMI82612.1 MarR family transcriptional regulator [Anaerotignum sp. MB30-C6]